MVGTLSFSVNFVQMVIDCRMETLNIFFVEIKLLSTKSGFIKVYSFIKNSFKRLL